MDLMDVEGDDISVIPWDMENFGVRTDGIAKVF